MKNTVAALWLALSANSVFGGQEANNKPIAIVTHSTEDVDYYDLAKPNHLDYALSHGYRYIPHTGLPAGRMFEDPGAKKPVWRLGLYWQKIEVVRQALQAGHPWVLWVDADVLFTNKHISLEQLIERHGKNKDFIIATDHWLHQADRVNAGVFLVKNSALGRKIMDDVAALFPLYKKKSTPEQRAIQDVVFGYARVTDAGKLHVEPRAGRDYDDARILRSVAIVPQRVLNAFYEARGIAPESSVWQPCDFAAHACAHPGNKKAKMEKLLSRLGSAGTVCDSAPPIHARAFKRAIAWHDPAALLWPLS